MSSPEDMVNVRYMVDDVQAAVDFYTSHLGFTLRFSAAPAFADLTRGSLRLLLAGPQSSVARLRSEGVSFRNEIITGPGGKQILIEDPAGNVVELFEPAATSPPSAPAQSLSSS